MEFVTQLKEAFASKAKKRWPDTLLNNMRLTGDEPADKAAAWMYQHEDSVAIFKKLGTIATNSSFHQNDFPQELSEYFELGTKFPEGFYDEENQEKLRLASDVFERHGFKIIGVLFFKSLPAGYMAPYPAKVLDGTKLLESNAARRVLETAQMIFSVFKKGWHEPGSSGIATIMKVRLMHAGMRYALRYKMPEGQKWNIHADELNLKVPLGEPINQEDMALTLNLFSVLILQGLKQLGTALTKKEREAYFYNWHVVGHFLGIDAQLRPGNINETWLLQKAICTRLYHPSNEYGVRLTKALLGIINDHTPKLIDYPILEDVTLYLLNEQMAPKSLGLHQPNLLDRIIQWLVRIGMLFLRSFASLGVHVRDWLEQKKEKNNSYLAGLLLKIIKVLRLEKLLVDTLIVSIFEHAAKSAMIVLQERAALSTGKSFFVDDKLVKMWDLGGFNMDVSPIANQSKTKKVMERGVGYILMLAAPLITGLSLYEFYLTKWIGKPNFPFGKPDSYPTIPKYYGIEMLGLGIVFLLTTVLVYIGMFSKKKYYYLQLAYLLLTGSLLIWLIIMLF
jgi:hypothetical protein